MQSVNFTAAGSISKLPKSNKALPLLKEGSVSSPNALQSVKTPDVNTLKAYHLYNSRISFGRSLEEHNSYGANVQEDGSVKFKIWNPLAEKMYVEIADENINNDLSDFNSESYDEQLVEMKKYGEDFEVTTSKAGVGSMYRFVFEDKNGNIIKVKDPRSKSQPYDTDGWSRVVSDKFIWHDANWMEGKDTRRLRNNSLDEDERLKAPARMIAQEIHIGSFTEKGDLEAAIEKLDEIEKDGIYNTVIVMPVTEFPGSINWGYDSADLFAVESSYGGVSNFKRFVNEAHKRGINVILDVVYNHSAYHHNLSKQLPMYYEDKKNNINDPNRMKPVWGPWIDHSKENVRNFIVDNALYWLKTCHCDGLRLDSPHSMTPTYGDYTIKEILSEVKEHCPDAIIISEEERDFLEISEDSHPDAKWNLKYPYYMKEFLTEGNSRRMPEIMDKADYKTFGKLKGSEKAYNYINYLESHDNIRKNLIFDNKNSARLVTVLLQNKKEISVDKANEILKEYYLSNDNADAKAVIESYKLGLATLFLSPGGKMLFMGDEQGDLAIFGFFRDSRSFYKEAEEKRQSAVIGQKGNTNPQIKQFTQDLAKLFKNNPALQSGESDSEHLKLHVSKKDGISVVHRKQGNNEVLAFINPNNKDILYNIEEFDQYGGFIPAGEWKMEIISSDRRYGGDGKLDNPETIRISNTNLARVNVPHSGVVIFTKNIPEEPKPKKVSLLRAFINMHGY